MTRVNSLEAKCSSGQNCSEETKSTRQQQPITCDANLMEERRSV